MYQSESSSSVSFKHVVVGKGMIGSAAAKYLSQTGASTAVIGPDEPRDYQYNQGVFASHYDSGRITRVLDSEYVWALAAQRSIERYRHIEERSNSHFFNAVGCLKVIGDSEPGRRYIKANMEVSEKLSVGATQLTGAEIQARFPFFSVSPSSIGVLELESAGVIDPRKLIAAQLAVGRQRRLHSISETVVSVTRSGNGRYTLRTNHGNAYMADRVLVTAGAFSNFNDLLMGDELDLRPCAETVVLGQVSDQMVVDLRDMPCLIYFIEGRSDLNYVYVTPPLMYPDGRFYIKIGGDLELDHRFFSLDEIAEWFHTAGGAEAASELQKILLQIIPGLEVDRWTSKPCVITHTATGRPYIGQVYDGIYVAAGGCGAAAKSSDEFGRLAALSVQDEVDLSYGEDAFPIVLAGAQAPALTQRQFYF